MNHFKQKEYDKLSKRVPELEQEVKDLRKQASKLTGRYWHKKRALREEAKEIASMVKYAKWRMMELSL